MVRVLSKENWPYERADLKAGFLSSIGIQDLDQSKNDLITQKTYRMAPCSVWPNWRKCERFTKPNYMNRIHTVCSCCIKTFIGTLIESNIIKMRSKLHEEISINIPNFGKLCNGSDGRMVGGSTDFKDISRSACHHRQPVPFCFRVQQNIQGSIKSWIPRLCDSTQGCQMANFAA